MGFDWVLGLMPYGMRRSILSNGSADLVSLALQASDGGAIAVSSASNLVHRPQKHFGLLNSRRLAGYYVVFWPRLHPKTWTKISDSEHYSSALSVN